MIERTFFIIAVYLLLIKDNKILLSQRYNTGFEDGNYGLIAGHVEDNEDIYSAIIREIKEEINIDINKEDLYLTNIIQRRTNENRLDFFFYSNKWDGNIINNEPKKCSDLQWFNIESLPNNTIQYIKYSISNYYKNKFYEKI